ncbi:hypothetical protein G647_08982 [Cladophialophora carrionii CBS 160.54]|uniref:Uncharacterized protein n=1 Tax=Cladophialophora carrionii CBS 160.54 TaxID=1279043 RepID=V9D1V7_9EURO|nr:uncharacterized protein G647_08982 [Cladophialophora carrionii CBS 160.54]ETI19967.1 hypothetical protein G647_08982 [Cladophialophora carrionii CBS 160.54]
MQETDSDGSEFGSEKLHPFLASTAHGNYQPKPYDDALIRGKRQGLTSSQIKQRLNLEPATSTLKNPWRLLLQWGIVDAVPTLIGKNFYPPPAKAPVSTHSSRDASKQTAKDVSDVPD